MATLKYSRQRESIKEFLMTRKDHPTADVVYENMKKIYPNISLGTVYRNLSLLSEIGEIQKLSNFGGADHFDGCVDTTLSLHVYNLWRCPGSGNRGYGQSDRESRSKLFRQDHSMRYTIFRNLPEMYEQIMYFQTFA